MSKKICGYDYSINEKVKIFFYLFVGGTAALFEWFLFYVYSHKLGWNYLLSTGLAYLCSTIYHYFATNALVFESGARYEKKKEFSLVLLVSSMGLGLNLILMRIFVGGFALDSMFSKVLASALVTVWNYLARKKWIY